jgi:hypothetical protein
VTNTAAGTWTGTANNGATGSIFNDGGTWAGDVIDNTNTTAGAILNAGIWTGNVQNNHGAIVNFSAWNGNVGTVTANLGSVSNTLGATWTGTANNGATGSITNFFGWFGNLIDNVNTATPNAVNNIGQWNGDATNHGQLTNSGDWTTNGTGAIPGFANRAGGVVNQAGTIDATLGGFSNTGTGTGANLAIVNASGGQINVVGGSIINGAFGQFNVTGTVTSNAATFLNQGVTSLLAVSGTGHYTVNGNINNFGSSASGGGINVAAGGVLLAFNVTNQLGATIDNFGTISDALNNSGTTNNHVGATYTADVINQSTGVINNDGTWNTIAAGFTNNAGGVVNVSNGSVMNATLGGFNNAGTINATGNSTLSGALVNNGTINLIGTAGTANINAAPVVTNTYAGTGTINPGTIDLTSGTSNQLRVGSASGNINVVYGVSGSGFTGLIPIVVATNGTNTATGASGTNGFFDYSVEGPHTANNSTNNTDLFVRPAAAPATAPLTSILSTISAIDASFHQPGGNLVASPKTDQPCTSFLPMTDTQRTCQVVGGPWARVSSGVTTISATGSTLLGGNVLGTVTSRQRVQFTGVQAGADSGWLNLGGSGVNAHFGVTGGQISATATEQVSTTSNVNFEVPFAGVYYLITKGGFSTDFTYRHSWYDMHVTNPLAMLNNAGFNGQSDNVNGSVSYTFGLPNNFFIEPTANLSYTASTFDNLGVLNNTATLGFNTVKSLLGRAGVRVGTGFSYGGYNWSPFGIALVQNEFEKTAGGTFTSSNSQVFNVLTDRVGTFYQTSLGLSFQSQTNGLLGFVRGDWRFGDKLNGGGVVGGVRYTFGP